MFLSSLRNKSAHVHAATRHTHALSRTFNRARSPSKEATCSFTSNRTSPSSFVCHHSSTPTTPAVTATNNRMSGIRPAPRLDGFGPTVWHEFTGLAQKHKSANLGQGFPNFNGPEFILAAARDALASQGQSDLMNQYARPAGHMRLVTALAQDYSPSLKTSGGTVDAASEVLVTVGASEALFASIQAFVGPGDEVVLVEPFFDLYVGAVKMAGGVPKYVPLRWKEGPAGEAKKASQFYVDEAELDAAMNDKTKLIVLNTPHNPTGKVFGVDDLDMFARVLKSHPQVLAISDEVYEHLLFDGAKHVRLASREGMWDRTITIGSAAKTFSVTGWKIGWCIGPKALIDAVGIVHSYNPFSVCTPLQEAVAVALETCRENTFYDEFRAMYLEKRETLVSALIDAGLDPVIPQGTFFVLADVGNLVKQLGGDEKLREFAGTRAHTLLAQAHFFARVPAHNPPARTHTQRR
eukprot:TRINITY_DN4137_c0_g1_i1.p1 TRINITY_DN4137_c0_g1~~TRINITY_DN4137_c0_g1_i1.p1  ORF type:complete len:465 (+),score=80.14 TRINITY_DN4137_c0_g1_i1:57-1451(+)